MQFLDILLPASEISMPLYFPARFGVLQAHPNFSSEFTRLFTLGMGNFMVIYNAQMVVAI